MIPANRYHSLSVRTKLRPNNFARVGQRVRERLTGLSVPNPRSLVRRGGDDALSIHAELSRVDRPAVLQRPGDRLMRLRVPYPGRMVFRGGDDASPCRIKLYPANGGGVFESSE